MYNFIRKCICLIFILLPAVVAAQDTAEMMNQFKAMSEGTEKNFPKELEVLMPKDFSIKTRGFIFKETMDMYLMIALTGTRKNDVYRKDFCLDTNIEISVFAYNTANAATYMMKDQMPVMLNAKKNAYKDGITNEGGQWETGPVQVFKADKADVFLQKAIRKDVELPDYKTEDQVYYNVKAVMVHKNTLIEVGMIYYPLKQEGAKQAVSHIIKTCLATNFDKYMK